MIPRYASFESRTPTLESEPADRWDEHVERLHGTRPKKKLTQAIDGHRQLLRRIEEEPRLTAEETLAARLRN